MPKRRSQDKMESIGSKFMKVNQPNTELADHNYGNFIPSNFVNFLKNNNQTFNVFNLETDSHNENVTQEKEIDENENYFIMKEEFNFHQEKTDLKLRTIFEFCKKLNSDYIVSKETINEMYKRIGSLENELNNLKSNNSTSSTSSTHLVELYQGSKLLIDQNQLEKSLKYPKFNGFINKIFTSVFSVEDVYRCDLKGRKSLFSGLQNKPFNKEYVQEIYNAISYHYSHQINYAEEADWVKKVDKLITKKLTSLNKHFQGLIKNKKDEKKLDESEAKYFENYEKYFNNPKLFTELEKQFENESLLSNPLNVKIKPFHLPINDINDQPIENQDQPSRLQFNLTNLFFDQTDSSPNYQFNQSENQENLSSNETNQLPNQAFSSTNQTFPIVNLNQNDNFSILIPMEQFLKMKNGFETLNSSNYTEYNE